VLTTLFFQHSLQHLRLIDSNHFGPHTLEISSKVVGLTLISSSKKMNDKESVEKSVFNIYLWKKVHHLA